MGMLMERIGGISIVDGGEEVTIEDEMDKEDRVEKSKLLGDGVYLGSQSSACSVQKKRQEVHPGVATFNGRVSGGEE